MDILADLDSCWAMPDTLRQAQLAFAAQMTEHYLKGRLSSQEEEVFIHAMDVSNLLSAMVDSASQLIEHEPNVEQEQVTHCA